jgi:hypothetical protein
MGRPIVTIDTSVWYRPADLAAKLKISKQLMNSYIRDRKVQVWRIPSLSLTLVKQL